MMYQALLTILKARGSKWLKIDVNIYIFFWVNISKLQEPIDWKLKHLKELDFAHNYYLPGGWVLEDRLYLKVQKRGITNQQLSNMHSFVLLTNFVNELKPFRLLRLGKPNTPPKQDRRSMLPLPVKAHFTLLMVPKTEVLMQKRNLHLLPGSWLIYGPEDRIVTYTIKTMSMVLRSCMTNM